MMRIKDCQFQRFHTVISSLLEFRDSDQNRDKLLITNEYTKKFLFNDVVDCTYV